MTEEQPGPADAGRPTDEHSPTPEVTESADQVTGADSSSPAAPSDQEPSSTPLRIPTPAALAKPGAQPPKPPMARGQLVDPIAETSVDTSLDPADVAAARKYGKVDADGTVSIIEDGGSRVVGQYPDVSEEEALTLYIRRFLDLKAQVTLFATRLDQLSARDLDHGLTNLREALVEPAAVGDIDGLRNQVQQLHEQAEQRKEVLAAERERAREQALVERTAIVERAEELAATDPAKVQWRSFGHELRDLLDQWKRAQKHDVRIDRAQEDALWKRFSHARSTFDRHRRQFFAELDRRHDDVKQVKEQLISQAENLAASTDWGPTSRAMRELMEAWKAAGRASRKDDDALWTRFRSAQDQFYQARQQQNEATDAEYQANLEVKLEILAEAEQLVPATDVKAAKKALRGLQERWDEAGRVPREQFKSVEARMRAVEQAIRGVEDEQWSQSNPRKRARAEGAAAQLEAAIADLEADVQRARASGTQHKIDAAQEALDARKAWLEQVLRAAEDAG